MFLSYFKYLKNVYSCSLCRFAFMLGALMFRAFAAKTVVCVQSPSETGWLFSYPYGSVVEHGS